LLLISFSVFLKCISYTTDLSACDKSWNIFLRNLRELVKFAIVAIGLLGRLAKMLPEHQNNQIQYQLCQLDLWACC